LAVVAEIGGDLVAPNGEGDAYSRRGPRSGEERHRRSRGSRGERNRYRRAEGDSRAEASAPGFDGPPSLALEEEFAASEADYSPASPHSEQASHEETMANPAPLARAEELKVEERAPSAGSAEPNSEASVAAEANPADAEASPEPPRPRRSGWWQRARATVIGK
jgi:ribonuclease E